MQTILKCIQLLNNTHFSMKNPIISYLEQQAIPAFVDNHESFSANLWEVLSATGFDISALQEKFADEFIDLTDNDYFCLRNHTVLQQEILTDSYEFENLQSEVYRTQTNTPHLGLREKLKQLLVASELFFTTSGYIANSAALLMLVDAKTPVYGDARMHESWYSAFYAARGRKIAEEGNNIHFNHRSNLGLYVFAHNSPKHLRKLLKKHGAGIVIIESVYSVEGDILNLEVVEMAKQHGCVIILDESHSIGGTASQVFSFNQEYGIQADVITFSLSKALASQGGAIAIQPEFIEKFTQHKELCKNFIGHRVAGQANANLLITDYFKLAGPLVFSNSLGGTKICLARLNALLNAEQHRPHLVRETSAAIVAKLLAINIPVASQSPILFLELGIPETSHQFRNALLKQGILGSLYFHPATPVNRSGVRFILNYDFCSNMNNVNRFIKIVTEQYAIFKETLQNPTPVYFQ
jgi:CAI-1 autoinducer synthase